MNYRNYWRLFGSIKRKSKRISYSRQLIQFQGDHKKTWRIMKEVISKAWKKELLLPRKIIVNNLEINEQKQIASRFNNLFIDIGPELAKGDPEPERSFESYIPESNTIMPTLTISVNELKNWLFSIKANTCHGQDEITSNVIRSCFGKLCEPLQYLLTLSFKKSISPDDLKITKVTPLVKAGDNAELSNYRPISALSFFPKILEHVMYIRIYKYWLNSSTLYKKQFGFQEGHPTYHAIRQVAYQMHNNFEQSNFTLGLFIDLFKAFDTDYDIKIRKKWNFGKNLQWFKNFINNRKQYIQINNDGKASLLLVKWHVPQGFILGPFLFLIYVCDLHSVSDVLDLTMFADDTNFFYSHKDIIEFVKVNNKLHKINKWFLSNIHFSINEVKRTIFPFYFLNWKWKAMELSRQNQLYFLVFF